MFSFVTADHFRKAPDHDSARKLFKNSVRTIEIEVFSYCNRRCWFCPNFHIDRRSANIFMDPALYTGIIRQLAGIEYVGHISYSRYNEPLADRVILDRLREAHAALPKATLHLNTNGDYLTFDYLKELYGAGLRSISIQSYLQNDQRYDHERMHEKLAFMIKKLGLTAVPVEERLNEWIELRLFYKDMYIRLYARNLEINGCHRGETIPIRQDYVRTAPCLSPFGYMYVDYNGKVMPCCNLRSDVPRHEACIVYDLSQNNDIFAAYAQSALVGWRRELIGVREKGGVCKNCFFPYHLQELSAEERKKQDELLALAQGTS